MLTSIIAYILLGYCGCTQNSPTVLVESPKDSYGSTLIRIYREHSENIKDIVDPGESSQFRICKTDSTLNEEKIGVVIENDHQKHDGFDISRNFKELKIILHPDGSLDKAYIR